MRFPYKSWNVLSFPHSSGEFKRAYPDAKLVAAKDAVDKKSKEGLDFFGGSSSHLHLPPSLSLTSLFQHGAKMRRALSTALRMTCVLCF
jgi:hypothetical protein